MIKGMKRRFLFCCCLFLLVGCGQGQSETSGNISSPEPESIASYEVLYAHGDKDAVFKDAFFEAPSSTYSKDLALLCFAFSNVALEKDRIDGFYKSLKFENPCYPQPFLDGKHQKENAYYAFASRPMDGYYLINVTFDGFEYMEEWHDNFAMGATGIQSSYKKTSDKAYANFLDYIAQYSKYKTKVFITGYSRAGAIAEIFSASLTDDAEKYGMTADDIYSYSIEAPSSDPSPKEYRNIHHIVNDQDMVPLLPPDQYGMKPYGVIHQVYDDEIASYVKEEFGIDLPPYTPILDCPTRRAFNLKMSAMLFEIHPNDSSAIDVSTREKYVNTLEAPLSNMVGNFMSKGSEAIAEAFGDLGEVNWIATVASAKGFADLMVRIADLADLDYPEEELRQDAAKVYPLLQTLIKYHLTDLLLLKDTLLDNLKSIIEMHMPSALYCLIKHS